jgi:hypothetical protein
MTEFSFPWQCTATGDGGPNSLSLSMVIATNQFLQNNSANSGVIYWTRSPYANLLSASNPSVGIVRIASGVGIVEGWLYTNDANVDFDINATVGNPGATDIIVLQRSLISQTVRLARIRGATGTKAIITQTAATWEVPIADVVLDGAGNFSSLVDARVLAAPSGSLVKIEAKGPELAPNEPIVIFDSIPPIFTHLRIIGWGGLQAVVSDNNITVTLNGDNIAANTKTVSLTGTSLGSIVTSSALFSIVDTSVLTNFFDIFDMIIPNYSQSGFKSIFVNSSFKLSAPDFRVTKGSFLWASNEAIHTISFSSSPPAAPWKPSSTKFVLYGII